MRKHRVKCGALHVVRQPTTLQNPLSLWTYFLTTCRVTWLSWKLFVYTSFEVLHKRGSDWIEG